MQFLVVLFPTSREVKVGKTLAQASVRGRTNTLLSIEGGKYDVTLKGVENFSPRSKSIDLRNTSELKPLTVTFRKV